MSLKVIGQGHQGQKLKYSSFQHSTCNRKFGPVSRLQGSGSKVIGQAHRVKVKAVGGVSLPIDSWEVQYAGIWIIIFTTCTIYLGFVIYRKRSVTF